MCCLPLYVVCFTVCVVCLCDLFFSHCLLFASELFASHCVLFAYVCFLPHTVSWFDFKLCVVCLIYTLNNLYIFHYWILTIITSLALNLWLLFLPCLPTHVDSWFQAKNTCFICLLLSLPLINCRILEYLVTWKTFLGKFSLRWKRCSHFFWNKFSTKSF